MNKENSKNIIIVLLLVIIIILSALVVLFATDTIIFNTEKELNDKEIIETSDVNKLLTNDEALNILKNGYNDVVRHIFNESVSYCGDYASGENSHINLNGFVYNKSASFNSFEELDNHVKKYLTEDLLSTTRYNSSIDYIDNGATINSYYEKDGSLYCNGWNKGSNMVLDDYSENESNFVVNDIKENSFTGTIDAVYYDIDNKNTTLRINVIFVKQNDNWLMDKYEEIN